MSVIINEFEVVMDNKQDESSTNGEEQAEEMAPSPQLAPSDIRDIVRHQMVRLERLWAH